MYSCSIGIHVVVSGSAITTGHPHTSSTGSQHCHQSAQSLAHHGHCPSSLSGIQHRAGKHGSQHEHTCLLWLPAPKGALTIPLNRTSIHPLGMVVVHTVYHAVNKSPFTSSVAGGFMFMHIRCRDNQITYWAGIYSLAMMETSSWSVFAPQRPNQCCCLRTGTGLDDLRH